MPNPALPPETGDIGLPESVVEAVGFAIREASRYPSGVSSISPMKAREIARAALLASAPHFQAQLDRAVAAEREACAKVAESEPLDGEPCLRPFRYHERKIVATAIRERSA